MEIQKLLPLLVFFLATRASSGELPNQPSAEYFSNNTDIDQDLTEDSGNDSRNRLLGINKDADMGLSESEKHSISNLMNHEGDPEWHPSIMKEAYRVGEKVIKWYNKNQREEKLKKGKEHPEKSVPRSVPTLTDKLISQVRNKLKAFGNIKMAKNADEELTRLARKWFTLNQDQRNKLQNTLDVISNNIETFAKAKENLTGAIKGALQIIASITSNFGPTGGMSFEFLSYLLGLFGAGPKRVSLSSTLAPEMIKVLTRYHEKTLSSQVSKEISALDNLKSYLDALANDKRKISIKYRLSPTTILSLFSSKMSAKIFFILDSNNHRKADQVTDYLELYAKFTALRDILLTQMIALSPSKIDAQDVTGLRSQVRLNAKNLFNRLYVVDYDSKIIPYFFPDLCPTTDTYATTMLGLGMYDRSLDGYYCLTYKTGEDLSWVSGVSHFLLNADPYTTLYSRNDNNCFWKLVPHGDNAYTIINRYKCDRDYDYCGALLSITGRYVGVERHDPSLWQIHGNERKRIRSKDGCMFSRKRTHWSCNKAFEISVRTKRERYDLFLTSKKVTRAVGKLKDDNMAYVWTLKKRPW